MTKRIRVSLDRANAEIAYADLAIETLTDVEREFARRRASELGAHWIEFYTPDGRLLGRAKKLRPPVLEPGAQEDARTRESFAPQTQLALEEPAGLGDQVP